MPVQLYSDNFSSDLGLGLLPPSGWTNEPAPLLNLGGYVVAVDGGNVLKSSNSSVPTASAGSTTWTNYTVSADVKVSQTGRARLVARHQSAGNFYACGLDSTQSLFLDAQVGGSTSTLASNGYSFNGTTWYHIDFSVQGNSLTCTVSEPGSGHSRTVTASATNFSSGSIGANGDAGAEYRNFVVTTLR